MKKYLSLLTVCLFVASCRGQNGKSNVASASGVDCSTNPRRIVTSNSTAFHTQNALLLGKIAMLAYFPDFSGQKNNDSGDSLILKGVSALKSSKEDYGIDDIEFRSIGDLGYVILVSKNAIMIGFRGSESPSDYLRNDGNLNNDLQISGSKFTDSRGQSMRLFPGIKNAENSVHTKALEDLIHAAKTYPSPNRRKLYITGHSRGGAMAVVFAYRYNDIAGQSYNGEYLLNTVGPIGGVYTYGSLFSGNRAFSQYYDASSVGSLTFRLVNTVDIGPTFPFNPCWSIDTSALGDYCYRHVGTSAYIDNNQKLDLSPSNPQDPAASLRDRMLIPSIKYADVGEMTAVGALIYDHLMVNYLRRLAYVHEHQCR